MAAAQPQRKSAENVLEEYPPVADKTAARRGGDWQAWRAAPATQTSLVAWRPATNRRLRRLKSARSKEPPRTLSAGRVFALNLKHRCCSKSRPLTRPFRRVLVNSPPRSLGILSRGLIRPITTRLRRVCRPCNRFSLRHPPDHYPPETLPKFRECRTLCKVRHSAGSLFFLMSQNSCRFLLDGLVAFA